MGTSVWLLTQPPPPAQCQPLAVRLPSYTGLNSQSRDSILLAFPISLFPLLSLGTSTELELAEIPYLTACSGRLGLQTERV